ncbi:MULTISPECIES: hypothetical protein [unclassified Microbacterium]|uniref:hypothetical protein n=1 Tax=unclassified Microbacterium TaxID=2609290 RepID=UPI00214B7D5B|nr:MULTISPECIES: hypothetical protein [unclassified Microbacterium]MCR2785916.1 hypothetical protein [Microbacterium sp. zg.B96]MDL5349967.1 hypothetical protein [Microbacterium sp. zg-YB36]WIM17109.1 hypothetical protein QNO11_05595 [Microbacterium sp. zg-B96]
MTEVLERRQRSHAEPPMTWPTGSTLSVARVDLVPPIVEARRRQGRTIRLLALGLVGLVIIVAMAGVAVSFLAVTAEQKLAAERTRSQLLLIEQREYSLLSSVKSQLDDAAVAEVAALYPEADWSRLMTELDNALPDDFALRSESITIKGVDAAGAVESTGLDAPGVIEIAFTATADRFDSPTPLLNALRDLTGYVSATVDAVSATGEGGYVVTGAIQLGSDALGGTARVEALEAELIARLQAELEGAATGAPPEAADEAADTADATDATETGE